MFINEEKLRQIISEEIDKAMTVKVTWERRTDDQGRPLAVPEIKTEDSNLNILLHTYIPRLEASMRVVQENMDKTKNRVSENANVLKSISGIMIALENSMKTIARVSQELKQLSPVIEGRLIGEGDHESDS